MFSAIQNPIQLWPSTLTGRACSHPSWQADGTVALTGTATLTLTPGTPGGTWWTQPRPSNYPPATATSLNNFSLEKGQYLILDNGVDPIDIVKVLSVNGVYVYLEFPPAIAVPAGTDCYIVDPVGYSPTRAITIKNVGGANGAITNAFGFTRNFVPGETETIGSDWTTVDPFIVDATGTTITLDAAAR